MANPMKRMEEVEEEKKRHIFKDNWLILMVISGLYTNRLLGAFNVLWLVIHVGFLVMTAKMSLQGDVDVTVFFSSLDYTLIIASVSLLIINANYYISCMEKMLGIILLDFHDYEDSLDPQTVEEVRWAREGIDRRKKTVTKSCAITFILAGIFSTIVFPALIADSDRNKVDNINRNLPIPIYYPFRTDTWSKWAIAILMEYWAAYVVVAAVSGTDIPFACFSEEGLFQIKKLGLTLKHAERRARYVYKKRHNMEVLDTSSPEFTACLRLCLNQSVKHHYSIISYFGELGRHYYHILLVLMMGATFLICVTGVLFMSKQVGIGPKLSFLAMLVAMISHTFIFNWYGELIANDVREMIYDSDWPDLCREFKCYLLIITAYLNQPIVVSAGGFMVCNHSTYGNVLSSAYSYFNLLSVMM